MKSKLDKILNPKSVAVIGASNKPGSVGNELMQKLTGLKFNGKLFGVNPKETKILGVKVYPSICNIPEKVDLAVIAVPAKAVLSVVDECHKAKVKNLVVISAGFKEIGGEGKVLEQQLIEKIVKYKMNMVGPNCLGVINTAPNVRLDASFAPVLPDVGHIGFVTQSGALAGGIISMLPSFHLKVGQVISVGNQADVNVIDAIEYWENDKNIDVIMIYAESIPNPQKFREIALKVGKTKPILAIKAGRSQAGARACASHTGSLAGDSKLIEGMLSSCGVIRELHLRDLFGAAQVLQKCPVPKGNNIAILTNVGGPGILTTDAMEDESLTLATLSEQTQKKLKAILPPQASTHNPVDMIASAPVEHYKNSAEVLLSAKEVDALIVIYLYITGQHDVEIAKTLEELKKKYPTKPIVSVFMTTDDFNKRLQKEVPNCSIPVFTMIRDAIVSFKALFKRKDFLENQKLNTPTLKVSKKPVQNIFNFANKNNIKNLSVAQSLEVFESYGLPIPKWGAARNITEAKRIAKEIGYPVVLKISSNTILHKSDVGGVAININNVNELTAEWNKMVQNLKRQNLTSQVDNIVVMQQIKNSSREFVLGAIKNESLGHQIMFGMGGIFIEILKEVTFRPTPLSLNDAQSLLNSTKAHKLLGSVRGKKPANEKLMQNMLLRLSQLVCDFPCIKEVDANPLLLDDEGNISTVDARIILE